MTSTTYRIKLNDGTIIENLILNNDTYICKKVMIPGTPNMNDLLPGDVLLSERDHTEMYIGDGKNVGAHSDYDGYNGDSSGNEINVSKYPNKHSCSHIYAPKTLPVASSTKPCIEYLCPS